MSRYIKKKSAYPKAHHQPVMSCSFIEEDSAPRMPRSPAALRPLFCTDKADLSHHRSRPIRTRRIRRGEHEGSPREHAQPRDSVVLTQGNLSLMETARPQFTRRVASPRWYFRPITTRFRPTHLGVLIILSHIDGLSLGRAQTFAKIAASLGC